MWCKKKLFVDHGVLSIEMNKNLSAADCMKNLKHSLDNAKNCKQKVPVKKHKRSEKKTVQVTLHQCQDFYLKK